VARAESRCAITHDAIGAKRTRTLQRWEGLRNPSLRIHFYQSHQARTSSCRNASAPHDLRAFLVRLTHRAAGGAATVLVVACFCALIGALDAAMRTNTEGTIVPRRCGRTTTLCDHAGEVSMRVTACASMSKEFTRLSKWSTGGSRDATALAPRPHPKRLPVDLCALVFGVSEFRAQGQLQ
jgi:hypothetical protein